MVNEVDGWIIDNANRGVHSRDDLNYTWISGGTLESDWFKVDGESIDLKNIEKTSEK